MTQEKLKAYLKECDDAYYNQDNPIISDIEYDKLKSQLDEYDYVPGSALFNKVTHTVPVISLGKVQSKDQEALKQHLIRLGIEEHGVILEPKLDGLTIVIYPDGRCITRGNGEVGEDVTQNCIQIPGVKGIQTQYPIRVEFTFRLPFHHSYFEVIL